jgi:type IV pilus assembly protein PilQ
MNMLKRIFQTGLFGFLIFELISCASMNAGVKSGSGEKNQINNIMVVDLPDKTRIVIEGNSPLTYTAFMLSDPTRFVIDLSDISAGKFKEKIEVNQGTITSIVPIESTQPSRTVRLEIGLLSEVQPELNKEGIKLSVDVPKKEMAAAGTPVGGSENGIKPGFESTSTASTTAEPAPEQKGEPVPEQKGEPVPEQKGEPVPEQKGEPAPVKNLVESVKAIQAGETVDVIISGDFSVPKIFMLKGNRLVVDIEGAVQKIRPLIQNIHLPPVSKIRIGSHPKPQKVRIVLDLSQAASFTTDRGVNNFVIHLNKEVKEKPAESASTKNGEDKEPPAEVAKIEKTVEQSPAPADLEPALPASTPSVKRKKQGNILFIEKTQLFKKKYVGERIFLDFQDMEIANALRIISEVSGLNFIVGEDVKGKVNLKLKNVPWDQALDLILKMNNLGQVREGNIIRVTSLGNITKQQDDELKAKDAQIKTEDLVTQIVHLSYAKTSDLMDPLKKSMSSRGEITADTRTNALIIKDVEKNANQVVELIKTLDTQTPQVLIEARIVQVSPTYTRSLGVQWGAQTTQSSGVNKIGVTSGITGGAFAQANDFAVNLPAASPFGGIGFSFGRLTGNPLNLDLRISAGEARGLTKIISTPKVAVLDNMEAKIEQGESIPYATTSQSGTQTTFVDANLTLTVTPHVTADGSVMMKINTAKNAPGATRQGAAGPSILKKQASTNILVKDGDTAVIGGIYENSKSESTSAVPLLSKIPILGWLFKNNQIDDNTSELMVFLTPKILR